MENKCVVLSKEEYQELLRNQQEIVIRKDQQLFNTKTEYVIVSFNFNKINIVGNIWNKINRIRELIREDINELLKEKTKIIDSLNNDLNSQSLVIDKLNKQLEDISKMSYWEFKKYKKPLK